MPRYASKAIDRAGLERLLRQFEILLIEATEDYYMLPDDGIVGKHALFVA